MPETRRSAAQKDRGRQDTERGTREKRSGRQDQGTREGGKESQRSRDERVGSLAAEQELDAADDSGAGRGHGPAGSSHDGGKSPAEQGQRQAAREKPGGDEGRPVHRSAQAGAGGRGDGEQPSDQPEPGKTQVRRENQDGHIPQGRLSAAEAAKAGTRGLAEVISSEPVGVTEVSPRHDGWIVAVEVVELPRLPSSADILAIYEAELDWDGRLRSYRRVKRYSRGRGEDGG